MSKISQRLEQRLKLSPRQILEANIVQLNFQNLEKKKWFIPYVIEPSAGVERGVLALLNEAYKKALKIRKGLNTS